MLCSTEVPHVVSVGYLLLVGDGRYVTFGYIEIHQPGLAPLLSVSILTSR